MSLTRRSFMQRTGAGGVTVLGASSAATLLAGCPDASPNSWLASHRRDTLNAFCDTVLPNENGDGGREARGLELIFDPYYAENGWIDEAVSELDGNSSNGNFSTLSLADRTSVLNYVTTYTAPWYSG